MVILAIAGAASVAYIRQNNQMRMREDPIRLAPLVCIDPGHPTAYSSGRAVVNGTTELEINWQVALKLEDILEQDYGFRVIKTREDKDMVMSNPDRAMVANLAGADLTVRLHCDAGPNHGFTVYYPNRTGEDLGFTGPTPEVIQGSRRAAYIIHSGMAGALKGTLNDRGVMGESRTKVGRKQGALTGSIFSEMPTVTVEMVFLTNHSDAEFIKGEGGQYLMAEALAKGIAAYLRERQKG